MQINYDAKSTKGNYSVGTADSPSITRIALMWVNVCVYNKYSTYIYC